MIIVLTTHCLYPTLKLHFYLWSNQVQFKIFIFAIVLNEYTQSAMKKSICLKKATLRVTFSSFRSMTKSFTCSQFYLCLKVTFSPERQSFNSLPENFNEHLLPAEMTYRYVLYLYEGISFQLPLKKSVFKPPTFTEFTYYFYQWVNWESDTTEKIKTQTLRWLVFCVNLTDVRDAQMAGKTLFPGVSMRVFLERLALDGIQYLSVDWIRKSILTHAGGCHPICWGSE